MLHVSRPQKSSSASLPHALAVVAFSLGSIASQSVGDDAVGERNAILRQYCADCHSGDTPSGNVDLEHVAEEADVANHFRIWEKVIRASRSKQMPPADANQPADSERLRLVTIIQEQLQAHIARYSGDPGHVVMRRLTSAEYAYSIQDLTGLDLRLERTFVNDAVGGEGFTNVGTAQFIQDTSLERYLEAAKIVADHAVIGAGPIEFFKDSGQTGRELSAIDRILRIYRQTGFRTAAGEGGEPFGLDLYPRALWVVWQYHHRAILGRGAATLEQAAREEGLSVRWCEHISNVVNAPAPDFPLSLIVERWRALPAPTSDRVGQGAAVSAEARAACFELGRTLREWQSMFANAAGDEEEAAVLTSGELSLSSKHVFKADLNWAKGATTAPFELSVASASDTSAQGAIVIWKNARVKFLDRESDVSAAQVSSLSECLAAESVHKLAFGQHPRDAAIGDHDFVLAGETTVPLTLRVPPGKVAAELNVEVELDLIHGANRIVRCRIADGQVEGETAAETGATSSLLADAENENVARWKAGVAEFARQLPEVSHREPAPSDRDPIPIAFDNTYNKPERNHFHTAIKYHRDDQFLVEHILDDATRLQLDRAWTDLLMSFDYHLAFLRFVCQKAGLAPASESFVEAAQEAIERLPSGPENAKFAADFPDLARNLLREHLEMRARLSAAEAGHVDGAIRLAQRAWRRPLTDDEIQRLRAFYKQLRTESQLDHDKAVRGLLARILVAPAFLFHAEIGSTMAENPVANVPTAESRRTPLSDWELASRLSYFLWSSLPDQELLDVAAERRLNDPEQLADQVRRMLRDPRSRRLATEFFGQWLGFYRFEEFRGIDPQRFPEFDEKLRSAMYEEAVSFFSFIVREDRPVEEILLADYTFVNARLAQHYGLGGEYPDSQHVRVSDLWSSRRGGLLGMGALHSVTSAPLRTSPVKRGDWVLRRVLGTPVPPPPADAGSIAADDVLDDGWTVRQRLEAHRTESSCRNCHARIDPLGFAMEHYDPIGRWRDTYRDGQAIDPSGTLSDGTRIAGPDGLRQYVRRERRQFERTMSVKLLGYALGRSEQLSDRPLVDEMCADLDNAGTFSQLVRRIVLSSQFRTRRSNAP